MASSCTKEVFENHEPAPFHGMLVGKGMDGLTCSCSEIVTVLFEISSWKTSFCFVSKDSVIGDLSNLDIAVGSAPCFNNNVTNFGNRFSMAQCNAVIFNCKCSTYKISVLGVSLSLSLSSLTHGTHSYHISSIYITFIFQQYFNYRIMPLVHRKM